MAPETHIKGGISNLINPSFFFRNNFFLTNRNYIVAIGQDIKETYSCENINY